MVDYVEKARENFLAGYNCSQALVLAFADVTGLTKEQAVLLSSSFGGGMGRLREVCGALTGLFMVDGLLEGYSNPTDKDAKAAHYARIQELAAKFRVEMGSILCRELLDNPSTTPVPDERSKEYYQGRPCLKAVMTAAKIGQEIVENRNI